MSPAAKVLLDLLPYLAALGVGVIVSKRKSLFERAAVGIVAMLALVLVRGLWPATPSGGAEEAMPREWPHLLNVVVFLPIVGALTILFTPRQSPALLKRLTLGFLALDLGASLLLLRVPMTKGWHFQYIVDWLPSLGIRYHVAVDGISLWLTVLTTFTTPIAAYASFGSLKGRVKDLCFAYLLLQGAMLGAFVALDLFLFYVFWELMLVPMMVLIGVWGGVEKIKAAYKFFIYTMAGSVLMLAAILYLAWAHHQAAGYWSFDYLALSRLSLPRVAAWLCFLAFSLSFFIKVPMFPFHTWLPDAHVQAPTGGSVILAAILLKCGAYGYLRFCMGLFPGPAWAAGANLAGIAVGGGILYGALCAWKQDDIKRIVAYSSVAHLGFVMLGLFAASQAGIEGAVLQMVNHGIATGALFILVGVIYDRRHTRLIREMGGLAKVMPVYAALFVIVTFASIGVPGTNGFVGEFMIIMGTFVSVPLGSNGTMQGVLAAAGVILAAIYMLSMVRKMFFGPLSNPKNRGLPDVNSREIVALSPLIVLIFVIGLFPGLFTSRMTETVGSVVERYVDGRKAFQEVAPEVTQPGLRERRGGPLERGYPLSPSERQAREQGAQALNEGEAP